jgi:2-oxoisovalerate dehydrogenase E2 component (dihydrolipoyl transacylase)
LESTSAGVVRDFLLPDLGEGLEDGEIVAWHVEVGDRVALNQSVADIETAKAVVTVPSPFAGVVVERMGEVGATIDVGSPLLRLRVASDDPVLADAETVPAASADDAAPSTSASSKAASSVDRSDDAPLVGYGGRETTGVRPVADGSRPRAKPPVRKLAKQLGVDLAAVRPTGPGGTVSREDVRAAARAGVDNGVVVTEGSLAGFRGRMPGEVVPVRGIRRRIIDKMARAQRDVPAASATCEADLSRVWDLRGELTAHARAEGHDVRITPFAVLLRATVLGLRRFPSLNARLTGRGDEGDPPGQIELLTAINLGFAVDTDRGLVVPNVKDAGELSLVQLAIELARLAARARDGTITPEEVTGGTFTVNNYGVFGNDDASPIVNHPEVGILGMGAIRERPWVVDGAIVPRRIATLRLVFDHRVCDGGEAGRFVTYVAGLCEEPSRILLHA